MAGKWAKAGGAYQGAVVAAGFILLEAIGLVPSTPYAGDALSDTVTIIVLDGVTLLAGAIAGWVASPGRASSSGTGRER